MIIFHHHLSINFLSVSPLLLSLSFFFVVFFEFLLFLLQKKYCLLKNSDHVFHFNFSAHFLSYILLHLTFFTSRALIRCFSFTPFCLTMFYEEMEKILENEELKRSILSNYEIDLEVNLIVIYDFKF